MFNNLIPMLAAITTSIRDRTSKLDRESLSLVGREWTPPVEQEEGV